MLRFARDLFKGVTGVTFIVTHAVRYTYSSGQGGSYTGVDRFTAGSMQDIPNQFNRVLQHISSAEAGVGAIYERSTLIEIDGQINGSQISVAVTSVDDLVAKLKEYGVQVQQTRIGCGLATVC